MTYDNIRRWRERAKYWLIDYCGGSCQCCGYKKCYNNLVFHHINRDKKESIHVLIRNTQGWVKILEEIEKCVLVCANCHGEIHAGQRDCPQINNQKRKETLEIIGIQPLPKIDKYNYCGECGKRINYRHKFCSNICTHKNQERIEWPDNLIELVRQSSKRAVARQLGVSDKAVSKRLCRVG
jgi:hypothetical protein